MVYRHCIKNYSLYNVQTVIRFTFHNYYNKINILYLILIIITNSQLKLNSPISLNTISILAGDGRISFRDIINHKTVSIPGRLITELIF